jgi:hypothetical protein
MFQTPVHTSVLTMLISITVASASVFANDESELITLPLRTRDANDKVTTTKVQAKGSEFAIIVMDMWDNHWDPTWVAHATARAESMNQFLHRARGAGAVIIHSPTNLITGYGGRVYQDTKQRQAASRAPKSVAPRDNGFMRKPAAPWGKNRYVGSKAHRMNGEPASRPNTLSNQCVGIDIEANDYITGEWGTLQDAWNILQKHDTKYLLYVGGATNMCLILKPIGLRHMKARGIKTVLVRDLALAWSDPYHWYDRNKKLPDDWGYTALKGDAFVADWIEREMSPAVTSGIFSGPAPHTLKLAHATATHSPEKYAAGKAIDGSTTRQNGWANIGNAAKKSAAVFELAETADNLCGKRLHVVLQFASHDKKHSLGKFRLSVTTDDRNTFADGKPSGGDVEANWTVLHPTGARTLSIATDLQVSKDGVVRAVVKKVPDFDCYYLEVDNPLGEKVTGFRLEALPDKSLPSGGPGLSADGNFVLGEINIRTWRSEQK